MNGPGHTIEVPVDVLQHAIDAMNRGRKALIEPAPAHWTAETIEAGSALAWAEGRLSHYIRPETPKRYPS